MELTHEEARQLIQFDPDHALTQNKQTLLRAHLKGCADCRAYHANLNEIEINLQRVMHREWDLRPTPLSIAVLTSKRNFIGRLNILLATRTALVSIALLVFIFGIWQIKLITSYTSNRTPLNILPVPTPSAQLTSTTIGVQNCEEIRYIVQENDTLEGLAEQFSTSKESIMTANDMKIEAIRGGTELIIPVCDYTPTSTVNPPTGTIYTPFTSPTTNTPTASKQS